VTELLSINLYEMVKANSFVGFSTTLIRRFTVQLLSSLQIMRNNRIIHCDLKPEVRYAGKLISRNSLMFLFIHKQNILLRHPAKSGLKVIDFGSSCFEHEKGKWVRCNKPVDVY
jgi:dual specificity tyrosine-phosphorylation-regulated kinase 2/3/4